MPLPFDVKKDAVDLLGELEAKRRKSEPVEKVEKRASDRFDSVILLGDLNYRINGNIRNIQNALRTNMPELLLASDQLFVEKQNGRVLQGFLEEDIEFAPTYKLKKGKDVYQTAEGRNPGWTDRILFKCKDGILKQVSYDAIP